MLIGTANEQQTKTSTVICIHFFSLAFGFAPVFSANLCKEKEKSGKKYSSQITTLTIADKDLWWFNQNGKHRNKMNFVDDVSSYLYRRQEFILRIGFSVKVMLMVSETTNLETTHHIAKSTKNQHSMRDQLRSQKASMKVQLSTLSNAAIFQRKKNVLWGILFYLQHAVML